MPRRRNASYGRLKPLSIASSAQPVDASDDMIRNLATRHRHQIWAAKRGEPPASSINNSSISTPAQLSSMSLDETGHAIYHTHNERADAAILARHQCEMIRQYINKRSFINSNSWRSRQPKRNFAAAACCTHATPLS